MSAIAEVPQPYSGEGTPVAAPKFPHPTRSTSHPTPDPAVTDDTNEVEGIDVEADVTQQGGNELGGKPSEQVEEDVKDLFNGSTVSHEVERKKDGYIVDSFLDDFRLLPQELAQATN